MKKLIGIIWLLCLSLNFVWGQNLITMGDHAFAKENYAKSAYFYAQYFYPISNDKVENTVYFPYELKQHKSIKEKTKNIPFLPPKVVPKSKDKLIVNKLAKSFFLCNDYKHAEEWYSLAVKNKVTEFPKVYYYYGLSLMNNNKYKEAKVFFEKTLQNFTDKHDPFYAIIKNKIKSCDFAQLKNSKKEEKVTVLGTSINKGTTAFGMMFTDNGLLFASTRKNIHETADKNDSTFYNSNIYLTEKIEHQIKFTPPTTFKGNANTYAIEGGATLLYDGKTILFTSVDPHQPSQKFIYLTRVFQGHWTPPFKLGDAFNVEGYQSITPSFGGITDDKMIIYYASNRPGGYGGYDIWKTTINQYGVTTPPVNLGSIINSANDEMSPFYDQNSKTIYFSSNGHIGYGGFDIFKSSKNIGTNQWGLIKNMGNGINSSRDDAYFIWNSKKNIGYFSSDRKTSSDCSSSKIVTPNCYKIYMIKTPAPSPVTIKGHVFDGATNQPLANAIIEFKDIRGELQTQTVLTNDKGFFTYIVSSNKEFFVKASRRGYFVDAHIIKTLGISKKANITKDFYLRLIPKEEIEIVGIEYDLNSSYLRDKSKKILDSLIGFLQLNDQLIVEIRSHTDINGEAKYNAWLSQRRAQRVVDYLQEHGIAKKRLSAKGYGATLPKETTINGKEVLLDTQFINSLNSEEEKEKYNQMNRRTTFKVLNN